MLDIQKELEKFNRLLEDLEEDEDRPQEEESAPELGETGSEVENTPESEIAPEDETVIPESEPADMFASGGPGEPEAPHLEVSRPTVNDPGVDARDASSLAHPGKPTLEPVPEPGPQDASGIEDALPGPVLDAESHWTVVKHVAPVDRAPVEAHDSEPEPDATQHRVSDQEQGDLQSMEEIEAFVDPGESGAGDGGESTTDNSGSAAFDSLMEGARSALTETHRPKPKAKPPVTVTLPTPEELEEDVERERGIREKIVPLLTYRSGIFQERMGMVVGVAAAVVLAAVALFTVPRMLSETEGDGEALASTMADSDSVHLLSSAESLVDQATASLSVSTFPPGARVYVGSDLIGVTPFQGISVERGAQSISIQKADYAPIDTVLDLDESSSLFFELVADPTAQLAYEVDVPVSSQLSIVSQGEQQGSSVGDAAAEESAVASPEPEQPSPIPNKSEDQPQPTGSVVITSEPPGATVFVDDEAVGETPVTLDGLPLGKARVTMQRQGYVPYEIELNVMPALQTPFHAVLAPMKGRVRIQAQSGADLYIDGTLVDRAVQSGFVEVVDVGTHTIKLSHPTYGDWSTEVEVRSDETTPVEVNLEEFAYTAAVREGDRLFEESRYAEAMTQYDRAQTLRPGERSVENKVGLTAKAMAESGIPTSDAGGVYSVADKAPELIGGLKALHAAVEYPKEAYEAGVQGRVYIQLVVDEKGRAQDVKIAKGLPMGCNEAAIRAVERARFRPGLVDGQPVKVRQTLFVNFTIE